MYKIVDKKVLNPTVVQLKIHAPLVANKARPGQFIILRVDENGERIPLTVAGVDKLNGTVKIIYQIVGITTKIIISRDFKTQCRWSSTYNGSTYNFSTFQLYKSKMYSVETVLQSLNLDLFPG